MLSRDQLAELYRGLQQEKVLTVYVDGVGNDPAERRVWRRRLNQELEREEHRLQRMDSQDLSDFKAAEEKLLKELDGYQAALPTKGWVGFATASDIRHAETLPVQVPNLVRWENGPRVAPYIRGLKQLRPMGIALVDSRRSRIFLYREGQVKEVEDLRADTFLGDLLELSGIAHEDLPDGAVLRGPRGNRHRRGSTVSGKGNDPDAPPGAGFVL